MCSLSHIVDRIFWRYDFIQLGPLSHDALKTVGLSAQEAQMLKQELFYLTGTYL